MLDDQDRDRRRQTIERLDQDARLAARNAGRRLVEQQHLRLERQRQRDLDEPLLAVGEQRHPLVRDARQMKLDQKLLRLGEDLFAPIAARQRLRLSPRRSLIAR